MILGVTKIFHTVIRRCFSIGHIKSRRKKQFDIYYTQTRKIVKLLVFKMFTRKIRGTDSCKEDSRVFNL